ncbi:thioredoxin domain-containing protein [Pyxidicoccus xibeiensis]|uniref:hypothetical protein n=1 Tax=Pyxidicoccus xibeiensis TaxID=2906759 RepID=UPI0020A70E2E|nr:hypothetical protein [Pyxidicoccus xibeiensis]MCP3139450.1 hypothetical protein [Pyxidicoccus xibeiensis]
MTITVTAFERSPARGRGLARDMRVCWALEEVGQPYEVRLLSFAALKEPAHKALHPFRRGFMRRRAHDDENGQLVHDVRHAIRK